MGSCAAPSAKGDDKFITTDYLQQCLLLKKSVMRFPRQEKIMFMLQQN
ncbi:replication initiator protein [Salmonella enterica subsp. enterica serovar Infantis]|nr:replication initiator protein [Salmonella enterica subsp. enterica serovar Infantis]